MAVSVGATPERWLKGLDRLVAAMAELMPTISWRQERVPTRWVLERGSVRASAPVDVLGGFPGSLTSTNRLERTSILVTDRYLVVGEGTAGGFALPMADILGACLVRPSRQANIGLVVHYRERAGTGTFGLNFRGLARGLSGRRRAVEILRVLEDRGVKPLNPRRIPTAPRLGLSWEDARRHANETLVWTGQATASVGGWYGATHHPCNVWVTEESLFWCCSEGEGVNRLALTDIVDVYDGVGERVRISIRDAAGHRFDIPFDFACAGFATSSQHRVRFLNVLASCGVAVSTAPLPLAPWRSGGVVRPTDRGR